MSSIIDEPGCWRAVDGTQNIHSRQDFQVAFSWSPAGHKEIGPSRGGVDGIRLIAWKRLATPAGGVIGAARIVWVRPWHGFSLIVRMRGSRARFDFVGGGGDLAKFEGINRELASMIDEIDPEARLAQMCGTALDDDLEDLLAEVAR